MKCRKIIIACLILASTFSTSSLSDEIDKEEYVYEEIIGTSIQSEEISVMSKCAVAFDRNTKTCMLAKNENLKVPMASTTKIMTAIIFLENISKEEFNSTVEVCKEAANIGGSRLGLRLGDKITMKDLIYGLMLCSGNDCAIQIATSISGSVEKFANIMNKKVSELGLENTKFASPHGLDNPNHYTTAYELALITDYALEIEEFKKLVNTKNYEVKINGYTKEIRNTNELLGNLEGVNGVKTGFTNEAGRCLVTSVLRSGFNIITVVLGADTKKIRTLDSIRIIEYVYSNYQEINLEELVNSEYSNFKNKIYVNKGIRNSVELKMGEIQYKKYAVKNVSSGNVSIEISALNYLDAPVQEGEIVGKITVKIDGREIDRINIYAKEKIEKKTVKNYLEEITSALGRITF